MRMIGGVIIVSLEFASEHNGTPSKQRPRELRLWSDWFRWRSIKRFKLELSSLDDLLILLHDLIPRGSDLESFVKHVMPIKDVFETEFSLITSILLK